MQPLKPIHKSGVHIATVYRDYEGRRYCVTYKRDWYRSFSLHFPYVPDKGYGQITSLNLLLYCQKNGIGKLVAVMPQGVAYVIDIDTFLSYYQRYKTDVPHLPGEVASPARLWTRLYPR